MPKGFGSQTNCYLNDLMLILVLLATFLFFNLHRNGQRVLLKTRGLVIAQTINDCNRLVS